MTDLFKITSKRKYRFNYKGLITVEDLWDLPVEELDKIYRNLRSQQKTSTEDSLIDKASKEDKILNNKIEIVKAIAADKLAAAEKAQKAAAQKAQNQHILEILADKKDAALKEKSIEELEALLVVPEEDDEE